MKIGVRSSLNLAVLGIATLGLGMLTGCGDNGPAPAAPAPAVTAAKNMYVIQNGETDDVETDSVLVFSATSSGATTPGSTLMLPSGYYAYSLAIGPTGKIYVGGNYNDDPSEILVFATGATGAATPIATYTGNTPGSFDYADYMTVNAKGELFVESDDESIEVYAADATSGDLPQQYITTFQTNDQWSDGIGADSAGNIYLADEDSETIVVFGAGATGAAVPLRTITGTATNSFTNLYAITADAAGNVMVANYNQADDPFEEVGATAHTSKVHLKHDPRARRQMAASVAHPHTTLPAADTGLYVFAAGASGAATPTSVISGALTTVNEPDSMGTDALDNIYYVDNEGGTVTIMKFAAGATGNVAPANSMTSSAFTGSWGDDIVAY
jgi:hypothetical protein